MWKHRTVNGWPLFWLLAVPMNIFMAGATARFDLASAEGVSEMIQYSVRWAVPFIYLVVAASAVPVLFPSDFTRWWRRNRRYLGLGAALAHTVHFGYVVVYSMAVDEPQDLVVIIFGGAAFVFLWLMALTSNDLSVRSLGNSWRILHRAGLHYVWLIFMQTFLGSALVNPMAWPFVGLGLAGLALRVTAWVQRRRRTG